MAVAHDFAEKARTNDVLISESVDFAGLLLSKPVLNGLKNAGFERPSPIQLKAIPLGRCGLDLIVQAKSGTGKTCVFSVVALEGIEPTARSTQVLVLAPTREIAMQIWEVMRSIGSAMPELRCHTFIGGLPLHEDKKKLQLCHIAVGTPGRIQSLIDQGLLKTQSIRLFVLDEADKLLEEGFQPQINWIYSSLPTNKQMLALSATYPEYLADHLTLYMRNPTLVRLNVTDPVLLGIKQYFISVASHPLPHRAYQLKMMAVIRLLSSVSFHQCLIFSNLQTKAQNLESELNSQGWPTTCIAGCLEQKDRINAMAKLKSYKCRVLISTDLTSRGIDADKVNLVINLDVPRDHETYLHRIGRAGRFGSYGAGVTIVGEGQEMMELQSIERRITTHILPLPDPIPSDLVNRQLPVKLYDVVSTQQLLTHTGDGEHRTQSDGEHRILTDGEHRTQSNGEHKTHHGGEHRILTDGEHKTQHDGEHRILTDGEHRTQSNGEHKTLHGGEHRILTDGEHETQSNGEQRTQSDGESQPNSVGLALCPPEGTGIMDEADTPQQQSVGLALCPPEGTGIMNEADTPQQQSVGLALCPPEGRDVKVGNIGTLLSADDPQESRIESEGDVTPLSGDVTPLSGDVTPLSGNDCVTGGPQSQVVLHAGNSSTRSSQNGDDGCVVQEDEDVDVGVGGDGVRGGQQVCPEQCGDHSLSNSHQQSTTCSAAASAGLSTSDVAGNAVTTEGVVVSHSATFNLCASTDSGGVNLCASTDSGGVNLCASTDSGGVNLCASTDSGGVDLCTSADGGGVDQCTSTDSGGVDQQRVANQCTSAQKSVVSHNTTSGLCRETDNLDTKPDSVRANASDIRNIVASVQMAPLSVKRSARGHATANLWTSMLNEQSCDHWCDTVQASEQRQDTLISSHNAIRKTQDQKITSMTEETVQLSFESELAMYIAARSGMTNTERSGHTKEHASPDSMSVASRPVSKARRRLTPGQKQKTSLPVTRGRFLLDDTAQAENTQSASVQSSSVEPQLKAAVEEGRLSNTESLSLARSTESAGAWDTKKSAGVSGHVELNAAGVQGVKENQNTPDLICVKQNQSGPSVHSAKQEVKSSVDNTTSRTTCASRQQKSKAQVVNGTETDDYVRKMHTNALRPPNVTVSFLGKSGRNRIPVSYNSALQDYKQHLEKNDKTSFKTASDIVDQTFTVPTMVDQSQCQQLAQFLHQFHALMNQRSQESDKENLDFGGAVQNCLSLAENEEKGNAHGILTRVDRGAGDPGLDDTNSEDEKRLAKGPLDDNAALITSDGNVVKEHPFMKQGQSHKFDMASNKELPLANINKVTSDKKQPAVKKEEYNTLDKSDVLLDKEQTTVKKEEYNTLDKSDVLLDKEQTTVKKGERNGWRCGKRGGRAPRYHPMAVVGLATAHMFDTADSGQASSRTRNTASVHSSVLTGSDNTASVHSSVLTGSDNTACVHSSVLTGSDNTASVHSSVLTGSDNTASVHSSVLTGNDSISTTSADTMVKKQPPLYPYQQAGSTSSTHNHETGPHADIAPKQVTLSLKKRQLVKNCAISPVFQHLSHENAESHTRRDIGSLQPRHAVFGKQEEAKQRRGWVNQGQGQGAIPKRHPVKQEKAEDSDNSSGTTTSTSTSHDIHFPQQGGAEQNSMCFHNQYAMDGAVKTRSKKLGPVVRARRKEQEDRVKRHADMWSSPEDTSHHRHDAGDVEQSQHNCHKHGVQITAVYGADTTRADYSASHQGWWYPYGEQDDHARNTHRTFPVRLHTAETAQAKSWSYSAYPPDCQLSSLACPPVVHAPAYSCGVHTSVPWHGYMGGLGGHRSSEWNQHEMGRAAIHKENANYQQFQQALTDTQPFTALSYPFQHWVQSGSYPSPFEQSQTQAVESHPYPYGQAPDYPMQQSLCSGSHPCPYGQAPSYTMQQSQPQPVDSRPYPYGQAPSYTMQQSQPQPVDSRPYPYGQAPSYTMQQSHPQPVDSRPYPYGQAPSYTMQQSQPQPVDSRPFPYGQAPSYTMQQSQPQPVDSRPYPYGQAPDYPRQQSQRQGADSSNQHYQPAWDGPATHSYNRRPAWDGPATHSYNRRPAWDGQDHVFGQWHDNSQYCGMMGTKTSAVNPSSSEDLALRQAVTANCWHKYLQKMAKFYAKHCEQYQ